MDQNQFLKLKRSSRVDSNHMLGALDRQKKKIHGEKIPPIHIRSKWIEEYLRTFLQANSRNRPPSTDDRHQQSTQSIHQDSWSPPPEGFWKMNSVASCSISPPSSGLGILCRNKDGECMLVFSLLFDFFMEPQIAELRGILEGMRLSLRWGCSKLLVESDIGN